MIDSDGREGRKNQKKRESNKRHDGGTRGGRKEYRRVQEGEKVRGQGQEKQKKNTNREKNGNIRGRKNVGQKDENIEDRIKRKRIL